MLDHVIATTVPVEFYFEHSGKVERIAYTLSQKCNAQGMLDRYTINQVFFYPGGTVREEIMVNEIMMMPKLTWKDCLLTALTYLRSLELSSVKECIGIMRVE